MPTVHQATWELLRALGVRKVFGNPGSTEMPFLANFPGDIDYVLGLHEGAVVGMADVYAQLTGEPTLGQPAHRGGPSVRDGSVKAAFWLTVRPALSVT